MKQWPGIYTYLMRNPVLMFLASVILLSCDTRASKNRTLEGLQTK
jgi:hypothetical protein